MVPARTPRDTVHHKYGCDDVDVVEINGEKSSERAQTAACSMQPLVVTTRQCHQ